MNRTERSLFIEGLVVNRTERSLFIEGLVVNRTERSLFTEGLVVNRTFIIHRGAGSEEKLFLVQKCFSPNSKVNGKTSSQQFSG